MFNSNVNGFAIKFSNDWTVSVQWGPGNYCGNEVKAFKDLDFSTHRSCPNTEIAAWDKDNNWFQFDDDQGKGWVTPDEVVEFMVKIRDMK